MNAASKQIQRTPEFSRMYLSATLIYYGFRLLGANKKHAWDRAKAAVANAVIDMVVEQTGIHHPSHKGSDKMQITFEGGPADREVRQVEICGTVNYNSDGNIFIYRRTNRLRGQSIIFELEQQ